MEANGVGVEDTIAYPISERPGTVLGPYSETAEQVGGYYMVSAPSLDALTAATGPLVLNGEHVEIRPTDRETYQ